MSSAQRLLLIQIRRANDVMAAHEQACVRRRLAERPVTLSARNALTTSADPDWLDDVDAVVIGGSGDYSVHHPDSAPWVTPLRRLLDAALARRTPLFGVCFGHQLLGLHLGGTVRTAPEHAEFGTVHLDLTSDGTADPVFGGLPARFTGQTGHRDSVVEVPSGLDVLATSEALEAQAFRVRDAPVWSAQFHPDLTAAEARDRYLAYQRSFAKTATAANPDAALKFELGADDAAMLLGRFADVALAG